MRISPNPSGNTVQEETTNPLTGDSGYDNLTLSCSDPVPEHPSLPLCHDPPAFPPGTSSATGNDFHRTLDQLNIPRDSPLKDRLTQFTVQVEEEVSKVMEFEPSMVNDPVAWDKKQFSFLRK